MIHYLKQLVRDLLYYFKAIAGRYPGIYFRLFARRYPFNAMRVSGATQICIEGFPRSANSYTVVAFKLNNAGVQPAHHLHVPAQILLACQMQLPVLLLLRDPLEAVSSFLVFQSSNRAGLYLKLYIDFYRRLLPWRGQVVAADFDQAVTNLSALVKQLNDRYKKAFNELPNQAERANEIFSKLRKVNEQFFAGQQQKSMLPDARREQIKNKARQMVAGHPLLKEARAVYRQFVKIESEQEIE